MPRTPRLSVASLALGLAMALPSGAGPAVAHAGTLQPADAVTAARANDWMRAQATGWTPNRGQVADASGRAASDVLFSSERAGARVLVTTEGLTHLLLATDGEEEMDEPGRGPAARAKREKTVSWNRIDVRLAGARIRPERVRPGAAVADRGVTNWYLSHRPEGVVGVPAYAEVTFPEVYPGIDWVVRDADAGGLHHDFVVHPGADPAAIRLEYDGAQSLELSPDGRTLTLRTALGELHEGSLACTQDGGRVGVGARFALEGSAVRIVLDPYDRSKPLVIDPPLVWSTYYGGSSFDGPRAIWCDNAAGTVFVVGYTNSTDLPLLQWPGAHYQGTAPAGQDAFIWKFNQLGARLWATYYGGPGLDFLADCETDPSGNLYACGYTMSSTLPTVNPGGGAYYQPASGGATDAFVLKCDTAGALQWATFFGGSGSDYFNALTTDAAGRLYAVGSSSSVAGLALANPGGGAYVQPAPGGALDGLVTRFGAGGALEWSTWFGGGGYDDLGGVAAANGSLYVTGFTQSTDFPTLDPGGGAYFQAANAGGDDAVIARFTLAGVRTWTTHYGGGSSDYADEPAVDASGNLFVLGDTYSGDFPVLDPGGGAYFQPTVAGSADFFLLKFDPAQVRLWATPFGGTDLEMTGFSDQPLALDANGNVAITGLTLSSSFPVLDPGGGAFYDGGFNGDRDAVLARFSNAGALQWSTYFGSTTMDFGCGVSFGQGGCLFATGEVTGTFTTVNPGFSAWYQGSPAGSHEGYVAKFCGTNSACCIELTCVPVSSAAQCAALGGTQFHPNQPCANVTCTFDVTLCGRKFHDLNRNGVADGGEPGIAGWTIALSYTNGPLYGTTVTDANGDYCFTGIPAGSWTVSEVQQPGWVQIAPAGAHVVSPPPGSPLNGLDFANFACTSTANCIGAPPGLAAWWPFDGGPGATTAADVTHAAYGRNAAVTVTGGSAGLPDALCFAAPEDRAFVPAAQQQGLGFGLGSFSVAAWVHAPGSGPDRRPLVERRLPSPDGVTPPTGWALYLVGLQCFLELGTGGATQLLAGPSVAPDAWTHVAVSIDRATGQGLWYLDGDPAPGSAFVPITGLLPSDAEVSIGQSDPGFGTTPGLQGCLADLALFSEPLTPAVARKAYDATPIGWCPEFALIPKVKTFCQSDSSVQLCFNIVNQSASPQTYQWSLAGLPAGPGCGVAGPTQIVPSAGTVNVAAGGTSLPICVTIRRPPGLVAPGATACVTLTFLNTATGVCRTRTVTLRADGSCWCFQPPQGAVGVPARVVAGSAIAVPVGNPCDPVASVNWRVSSEWLDADYPDPQRLSLNGLPPGAPVTGSAAAGSSIDVTLGFPGGFDFAARYEVLIEADTDGDGDYERIGSTLVQPTYDAGGIVAAPRPQVTPGTVRLAARPNPFAGGSSIAFTLAAPAEVELGVYDLNGRLVRSLVSGRLAEGPHRIDWDGRDGRGRPAPAGVYFVRLAGAGPAVQVKLVKMR